MTVNLSLLGGAGWQFLDNNGSPLSGGLLYTYQAGTALAANTYTSASGVTPNSNPVVLNAAGRVQGEIWLTQGQAYKFVLKTSTGVTLGTYDNVPGANDPTSIYAALAASSGSSLIGYLPAGSGAVATTVQTKLRETVSVLDFGAVGNGVVNDTAAIQAALNNAGTIVFPAGTFTVTPLTVLSNTTLILNPNTILKAKTGYGANDSLLNISNVSNVVIQGNFAKVQMLKADYTTGEQRHGVFIVTGVNVTINDLIVTDTGGDGFYIGSYDNIAPSYNVTLNNCIADNARRNGLSIVSVKNCWINGGEYRNTIGTAPQSGIDVEPNSSDDFLWNVNINGVSTYNNYGDGISVVLGLYGDTAKVTTSINIVDCTSRNDAQAFGNFGLRFVNGPLNYKVYGSVNVTNFTAVDSGYSGIGFLRLTENYADINITKCTILNPGSNVAAVNPNETCGVFLTTNYNAAGGWPASTTQNIKIDGLLIEDTRATAKMNNGIYMQTAVNYPIKNVTVQDAQVTGYTNVPYIIASAATNGITQTRFVQNNPELVVFTGTTPNDIRWTGDLLTTTTSGNFTLSDVAAAWIPDFVLSFVATASTMTLVPFAGDTILFQGLAASSSLILTPGDSISLKSVSTGWEVVAQDFPLITGAGSPVGVVIPRFIGREYFDTTGKLFWMSTGTTAADWKQSTN